jgi:hypothetical protein
MRKKVILLLILTCAICHTQLSHKTINAMTWGAKTKLTNKKIKEIQDWNNSMPRKILEGLTANESTYGISAIPC